MNGMQRSGQRPGPAQFPVERVRTRQGPRVGHDDRVDRRTAPVVGVDAGEVGLHQLTRRECPGQHPLVCYGVRELH